MRIQRYKCCVCGAECEYEHGGDKGYSYDPPLCGPHCGGVRAGRAERDAQLAARDEELKVAREAIRMAQQPVRAIDCEDSVHIKVHIEDWTEHWGALQNALARIDAAMEGGK